MHVNLDKELNASKVKRTKELNGDNTLKEAKQLLLTESTEDARILRHMGANSTLMQIEHITGQTIRLEELETEYGQVFQVDQIAALAIKYRLRMLPSNYFIGKMDVQVTAEVKKFAREIGVDLNEHDLSTRFFILATPDSFKLRTQKVEHFANLKASLHSAFLDPILFYKIDEEHYRMIHKWGNDFTVVRRLIGYKWQNPGTVRTFNFFFQLPFIALLFALLIPTAIVMHPMATSIVVVVLSALTAWIRNIAILKEGGMLSNDSTEYHNGFFTNYNWNSVTKLAE